MFRLWKSKTVKIGVKETNVAKNPETYRQITKKKKQQIAVGQREVKPSEIAKLKKQQKKREFEQPGSELFGEISKSVNCKSHQEKFYDTYTY